MCFSASRILGRLILIHLRNLFVKRKIMNRHAPGAPRLRGRLANAALAKTLLAQQPLFRLEVRAHFTNHAAAEGQEHGRILGKAVGNHLPFEFVQVHSEALVLGAKRREPWSGLGILEEGRERLRFLAPAVCG